MVGVGPVVEPRGGGAGHHADPPHRATAAGARPAVHRECKKKSTSSSSPAPSKETTGRWINVVGALRFLLQGTVEERLQQVQARKQRMIEGALTDEEVRTARIEELKRLFK